MIVADSLFEQMINSPARSIKGRVELYDGSTLLDTYTYNGALQSFTIDRVGENNKFFGFGICQKLTVKLRDKDRQINIVKGNRLEAVMGVDKDYLYPYPVFTVQEVKRDENTNGLTITAYDSIYEADNHLMSEVELPASYTIKTFAHLVGTFLGMPVKFINIDDTTLSIYYDGGANFEGTETVRYALNAVAEATQSIYYMDKDWNLTFKRLDKSGDSVLLIDKSKYFTLSEKNKYNLETIIRVTELGDNLSVTTDKEGSTQYVRDNPFWDLRDDIVTLLNYAIVAVGGLSITQFDCSWRGNFLLEIGDKISINTKDNDIITTYVLNDVVTYNGGYSQKTQWSFEDNKGETPSTPSTVGEAIKKTYAVVDKINARIDLYASKVDEATEQVGQMQVSYDQIYASVGRVENNFNNKTDAMAEDIETLSKKVDAAMTPEEIQIEISKVVENGTNKVTTSTGYKFDEEGLTISKSNSEISTQITEDGMTISRSGSEVLVADNTGVYATNLRATTYLIIGTNSRFEDYDSRTGCFWIGP